MIASMVSASIEPLTRSPPSLPEHRFRFGMFAKQPAIDQRRQIFATLGGKFKAVMDRIARRHRGADRTVFGVSRTCEASLKKAGPKEKEQGEKPCSKNCVDPISPKSWI